MKRYVPELAGFDAKYIYEPSKAPVVAQKKAGCMVRGEGKLPGLETEAAAAEMKKDGSGEEKEEEEDGLMSYPRPMFDFARRREFCIKAMKDAYRIGLHGDDPRVLDGSWKELFEGTAHDHDVEENNGDDGDDNDAQKLKVHGKPKRQDAKKGSVSSGVKREAGQQSLDKLVKRTKK